MATFSVIEQSTRGGSYNQMRILEIGFVSWGQYQPSFQMCIREGGGNNFNNQILFPLFQTNNLIANIQDPVGNALVTNNNKLGNVTVGRRGNEFVIQNSSPNNPNSNEQSITLLDPQWMDVLTYFNTILMNSMLIKEITWGVRMQMVNVLRSVGIDYKDPATNRFKIPMWWDDAAHKGSANIKPLPREIMDLTGSISRPMPTNNPPRQMPNNMPTSMPTPPTGATMNNNRGATIGMMGGAMPPLPPTNTVAMANTNTSSMPNNMTDAFNQLTNDVSF